MRNVGGWLAGGRVTHWTRIRVCIPCVTESQVNTSYISDMTEHSHFNTKYDLLLVVLMPKPNQIAKMSQRK